MSSSPVKRTQSNSQSNKIFFSTIFQNMLEKFLPMIEQELQKISKAKKDNFKELSESEYFDIFPRSNHYYSQMISNLADIAQYDIPLCIYLLVYEISQIIQKKSSNILFTPLHKLSEDSIYRHFELLLLTDLICTIVSSLKEIEVGTADNLLKTGLYLCTSIPNEDFSIYILKQWSVIFSYISLLCPTQLFEKITGLIINKYDLFFILIRYVRLDHKECVASNYILFLSEIIRKAKMKNSISSLMFISLSNIILTYNRREENPDGEVRECINDLYKTALDYVNKNHSEYPGAVDVIASLLPYQDYKQDEIDKFYEEHVYKLAAEKDGILNSARSFRTLMFGRNIDPASLFYVWNPNATIKSFELLDWKIEDHVKSQNDCNSFTSKFMKYYFNSEYFNVCSSLFQDLLIRLAALDFENYLENVFEQFAQKDFGSPQFIVFMNTVPIINDKRFKEKANVTQDQINEFNTRFEKEASISINKVIQTFNCYTFALDTQQIQTAHKNSDEIQNIFQTKWGVELSAQCVEPINKPADKDQKKNKIQHAETLYYMLNSPIFKTESWIQSLLRLASSAYEEISKPVFNLCISIFSDKDAKEKLPLLEKILEMMDVDQTPELFFTCLSLLNNILDLLSLDQSHIESIEFIAFLALASKYCSIRVEGYKLLKGTNRLLQNEGIFSKIEDHLPAISSNAKHNILLQTFPRHPGGTESHEDELNIEKIINNYYQEPWLYFLAEFCRVIVYSNYTPLLQKIAETYNSFQFHDKEEHLDLGILVILLSTCTDADNVEGFYVYDMPQTSDSKCFIDELQSLELLKSKCLKNNCEMFLKSIKYTNYTIVHLVLNILNANFSNEVLINHLQPIHMMLSATEGANKAKQKAQSALNNLYHTICVQANFDKLINNLKMNMDHKNTEQTLLLLTFIDFCMELKIIPETFDELKFLMDLQSKDIALKENSKEASIIYNYASWCTVSYISKTKIDVSIFQKESKSKIKIDILEFVKFCSKLEKSGYQILKPLLSRNTNKEFFTVFINSCFQKKSSMSDIFFDAIYKVFDDAFIHKFRNEENESSNSDNDQNEESYNKSNNINNENNSNRNRNIDCNKENSEISQIYRSNAGVLLLLVLLKIRTGSPLASKFLSYLKSFLSSHGGKTQSEIPPDSTDSQMKDPTQHFERFAEQVVKAGLYQMKQERFKISVKVMVDILEPWIKKFQLLARPGCCVPSVNTKERYTPQDFLNDLLEITKLKRFEHDFSRIAILWATLILTPNNTEIIPTFIAEKAGEEDSRKLFTQLLHMVPVQQYIVKFLAKRCKFAFYAFCIFQKKNSIDQELWMIPVITNIIKTVKNIPSKSIPPIIQFAILFHSNQTQSLLKRLCKYFDLQYSRKTLSSISIRRLVSQFEDAIKQKEINKPVENQSEHEDIKKKQDNPLDIWAGEAMRWAIGSKDIKLAYTSMIILNQLKDYSVDSQTITDLLRGVCKSTVFFLGKSIDNDEIIDPLIYDFIDEIFVLFKRHFQGHEKLAFNFIKSFLSFVVDVDAYFEKMLPLYQECLNSPTTKNEAEENLLVALRPSLNELEGDSEANKAFTEFIQLTSAYDVDLKFVNYALQKHSQDDNKEAENLIEKANNQQLNRAVLHYSLMIVNASNDMKKRIFDLTTKIIWKTINQRSESRKLESGSNPMERMLNQQSVEELPLTKGDEEDDSNKNDLNKQALVVLFRSALQMLPGVKEPLQFIKAISQFDPLIPNTPLIRDLEWKESAKTVINSINSFLNQENTVINNLTNCKNLAFVSNILTNPDSKIKILPFGTLIDTLQSICPGHNTHKHEGGRWFDRISKKLFRVGLELQKKFFDKISSPTIVTAKGEWDVLSPPQDLIPDDKLLKKPDPVIESSCTLKEFLEFKSDLPDQIPVK